MLKSSKEALSKIPIRWETNFRLHCVEKILRARTDLQDRRQLRIPRTSSTRWGCNQRKQRIMRFRQSRVPWTNVRVQKSQSIPSQYQHPTILWALQQAAWTYSWPTLGRDREKTRSKRTHDGSDIIGEHSPRHSPSPDDPSRLAPTRKRRPPGLLHQDNMITCKSSISGTQVGLRNWPSDGFHLQAWQKILPTCDHQHGLVGGIGDQEILGGTQSL